MKPTAGSCAFVVCLALAPLSTAPVRAQQAPSSLGIVIVQGEGQINKIEEQGNLEPVIQVQDQNQRPVAGASVVFFLPNRGPGGTFFDGAKSLTVTTDAQGRATARGIRFNDVSGQMQIRVTASFGGQTATATITQNNVGGGSGKGLSTRTKVLIVAGVAAGAAISAIVATRGGGSSSSSPTPITITAGTATVGAP